MTSAYIDCICPPQLQALGAHQVGCPMVNPDALVACPPGGPCCQQDHDHAAEANACPGGHGACPEPESCRMHANVKAHHAANAMAGPAGDPPPDDCPGGHCHVGLDDCTVCRPLIITAMPGSASIVVPGLGG